MELSHSVIRFVVYGFTSFEEAFVACILLTSFFVLGCDNGPLLILHDMWLMIKVGLELVFFPLSFQQNRSLTLILSFRFSFGLFPTTLL